MNAMKRICLFAGYHPHGEVAEYAVYYIKALAELADVYYWADCEMSPRELEKLAPYVKGAWADRHGKYDFGSWQELVRKIGWEKLAEYDECIFCNDSVFAPLFPLEPVFASAEQDAAADAWALNSFEGDYFGSFFFVLKQRVFRSEGFRRFLEGVVRQPSAEQVINLYEKRLPGLLRENGFSWKVWVNAPDNIFCPWRSVILRGLPVLKIKTFTRPEMYPQREFLCGWRQFLQKHTSYPVELAEQHLRSIGVDTAGLDGAVFRCKSFWWGLRRLFKRMFRIHLAKKDKILTLFGITFIRVPSYRLHMGLLSRSRGENI